ncbi:MAG: GTP-binding protein [Deltaproteobacteria bacterium SG8_13]|nr:MAG: GTP-binding protein [Deltaproteobacteria bacterium SG8_13]
MSQPRPPKPAKLVISMFMSDRQAAAPVVSDLCAALGPVDMISQWMRFGHTNYYAAEMGEPLHRRMVVFKELIEQQSLAEIKHFTNRVERRFADGGRRRVNIDPGYLLPERFVLATGKNYSHRIFIGQGIYADLTLIYRSGGFHPLEWTYPDYREDRMRNYLCAARRKYLDDLQRGSRI